MKKPFTGDSMTDQAKIIESMSDIQPEALIGVLPANMLQGQTIKQPTFFMCPNPECIEGGKASRHFYVFESDEAKCPKCTLGHPYITKRSLVHLLLRNNSGPIVGHLGLRWEMACDAKRTTLATGDNGEATTGDSRVVNCPGCLKRIGDRVIVGGQSLKQR